MKVNLPISLTSFVPMVLVLLVCGTDVASAAPPSAGGLKVLRFGVHVSAMGSLDPHLAAGSQDRALADMVFNGLLRYQPGNAPTIEPDLAERIPGFEMIGGRQVWTVKLRRGVWFHPGPLTEAYELTAEDVVYSFQKAGRRECCSYAGEYEGITVEAVDRYTVRITVDQPVSSILFLPKLTDYAGGFIVSKRAREAMGADGYMRHPVGTGPFMFSRHIAGEQVVLTAHDRYFRGRPLLDGIQIRMVPEIAEREADLKAGRLDVIMGSGEKGWL
ncbi:MAG: ABC transporter substrate-binding protein, partial [Desulfosarcina sp.]